MCARIVPNIPTRKLRIERLHDAVKFFKMQYDPWEIKKNNALPPETRRYGMLSEEETYACKSIVLQGKSNSEVKKWVENNPNNLENLVDQMIELAKKEAKKEAKEDYGGYIHLVTVKDAIEALKEKSKNKSKEEENEQGGTTH